jgi:hypothetical protein
MSLPITPGITNARDIGDKAPAHPIRYCQAMVLCPITMVRRVYWKDHGTAYLVYYTGGCVGLDVPLPKYQTGGGGGDPKNGYDSRDYWVCVPIEYFEEPENEWGEVAP